MAACGPVLSFSCVVLLVIPTYLLCLELFGSQAAWLAGLLVAINPIVDDIVVNVLSESTFLIWWTFGLWCAIKFLRHGRFGLAPTNGRHECARLPDPARGNAFARGAGDDPRGLAVVPGHPDRVAEMVARRRLHGGRGTGHGRTVHRDQGGRRYQAGHCPCAGPGSPGAAPGTRARQAGAGRSIDLSDVLRSDRPHDQGVSRWCDFAVVPVCSPGLCPGGKGALSRGDGFSYRSSWQRLRWHWCGCTQQEVTARPGTGSSPACFSRWPPLIRSPGY